MGRNELRSARGGARSRKAAGSPASRTCLASAFPESCPSARPQAASHREPGSNPGTISPAVLKARPLQAPRSAALNKGAAMMRAAPSGRPPLP